MDNNLSDKTTESNELNQSESNELNQTESSELNQSESSELNQTESSEKEKIVFNEWINSVIKDYGKNGKEYLENFGKLKVRT